MTITEVIDALKQYQTSTPDRDVKVVRKASGSVNDISAIIWNPVLGCAQITIR